MTPQTPRILEGTAPAVAMNSLDEFAVRSVRRRPGGAARGALSHGLRRPRARHRAGDVRGGEDAAHRRTRSNTSRRTARTIPSPSSASGSSRSRSSSRADVGLEIAFADVGGWDTHVNQGGATGQLAQRLDDFAKSIAALVTDLGDRMENVVILTMSRVRPHGAAERQRRHRSRPRGRDVRRSAARCAGGRSTARWPGLAPEQLYEGRDLALTTDFRAVFSEIVSGHLGATNLDAMFPGFTAPARLGLLG